MKLLLGLAFAVAFIVPDGPSDWPTWRGANRDGLSSDTGLLKQWPSEGPPLAWKATGIGRGYSSVSVYGDRLFTMGDVSDTCTLIALNVADGKVAWTARVGRPHTDEQYPGPRATPSTDGTIVLTLGPNGELVCVEAATGKERWRKDLPKDFGGKVGSWKYSESPLLDGDHVVVTAGGKQGTVLALKKETGEKVWQSTEFTDGAEYSSLVPVEISGVRQYLTLTKPHIAGIAAKDGKLLWMADRPLAAKTPAVVPTPIYQDGIVFTTSGYGVGCNAFKITPEGDRFKAEEVYAGKQVQCIHGGVIRVGEHLYLLDDSRNFKCVELKSGKEVWKDRSVGSAGSVAYADGHFVCRSDRGKGKGTVALVEATPEGYKEKGRFEPPDQSDKSSWSHPVLAGGKLYLRDQDVLLCYDVKSK